MTTQAQQVEADMQGVHFASRVEEISPEQSLEPIHTVTELGEGRKRDDLNAQAEQELQQLKTTLKNNIQSARMQHHAFEPVSLPGSQPASRVWLPSSLRYHLQR
jgi:hypothetical protein